MLERDEEERLVASARRGDRAARDRLAEAFEPLVGRLARSFAGTYDVEQSDLAQAGREALLARLVGIASYDSSGGRLSRWLEPGIAAAMRNEAQGEARSRVIVGAASVAVDGDEVSLLDIQGELDPGLAAIGGELPDDSATTTRRATSAADRYLRRDRFPELKRSFVDFMVARDPDWRLHAPTWKLMTESPAIRSLLERVRAGQAPLAAIEQEYLLFVPERRPRCSIAQEVSFDDEHSRTLASIVCDAAEHGTLAERAQWRDRGASDAVAAVAHFRRWVLGGEPQELWPDPIERSLAVEHWVAERALSDPPPDPDCVLHYVSGKTRAVAWGGDLGRLKRLALQLERDFGWSEETAVRFTLTGIHEITPKLRGRIVAGGLYGATARVYLDIDPRATPQEVAGHYERWRVRLAQLRRCEPYPTRARATSARRLALALFVEENWRPDADWEELRRRWEHEHPQWRYPDSVSDPTANFANHARQAWTHLTGTPWPDSRGTRPRRA